MNVACKLVRVAVVLAASLLIASLLNVGPLAAQQRKETPRDAQKRAVAAKDALFKQLSTRLMDVIQKQGPAAAIEVCRSEAPEIATSVSKRYGVKMGRTSFKTRNPSNQAPQWANPLIEKRVEDPTFVSLPEGKTGALLPIVLKSKCVTCHGPKEQLAKDVRAALQRLYPDDQATGFAEGDLRGWFWVEVPAQAVPEEAAARGDRADNPAMQGRGQGRGRGRGPGRGKGPGQGRGPGAGRGGDARFDQDHDVFFFLLTNRKSIDRKVTNLKDGIETVTESDDPKVAAKIQEHVEAMYDRVEQMKPIHMRDPLFREVFRNAKKIKMELHHTEKGVRVIETSNDPYVAKLIQAHAVVVNNFIKNGHAELRKNHALPKK